MGNTTVAVHQPNYLPWNGYFYKLLHCDVFVFLDNVQFTKHGFVNRNKIKGPNGTQWLTVPVRASVTQNINEVSFADKRWSSKHLKTLDLCYRRAPFYEIYRAVIAEILQTSSTNIAELNKQLILAIAKSIQATCRFVSSSELPISNTSNERIIQIVNQIGGSVYLSGRGAVAYQDEQKFDRAGLELKYYNFTPPLYPQLWGEFEPGLSIVDLLFNIGPRAGDMLRGG